MDTQPMAGPVLFSVTAWKGVAYNFVVWLIPGMVVFAVYLVIIIVSILGGDGSLLEIRAKLPKGLLSFMGVALLLSAGFGVVCFFLFDVNDMEGIFYLSFFILICSVAGFIFLRSELKRLAKI